MSTGTAQQLRARVPRIAGAAVERARLTVVPRRRVRAPRVPFVTLVSLVLLGGVVGLLCFNTQMQQVSFAASSLENQASTLDAREQTLQMELEKLRDPQRVAATAQRRGMVIAPGACSVSLAGGKVEGLCPVAVPGNTPRLLGRDAVKPAVLSPPATVVVVPPASAQHKHQHKNKHKHKNDKNQKQDRGADTSGR